MPNVIVLSFAGRSLLVLACFGMVAMAAALLAGHNQPYEYAARRASLLAATSGLLATAAFLTALITG